LPYAPKLSRMRPTIAALGDTAALIDLARLMASRDEAKISSDARDRMEAWRIDYKKAETTQQPQENDAEVVRKPSSPSLKKSAASRSASGAGPIRP
jgi:hypothetical protein